ncbi:MAG: helix-turn-helix domain-containing protein [Frankia sp.]
MTTQPAARRTGRPRDASIDARALNATRQLLTEDGFAATTIQAIAERSGVHTSAIYRRWPSRLELIEDAAFADLPARRARPTGDLAHDLGQLVRAYVTTLESPVVHAALPALLSTHRSGEHARTPEALLRISVRPWFRDILAAAPPDAVDPDVDADDVFDMLLGAVLVRLVLPEAIRDRPPVERTVDLLLRVLAPRTPRQKALGHRANPRPR